MPPTPSGCTTCCSAWRVAPTAGPGTFPARAGPLDDAVAATEDARGIRMDREPRWLPRRVAWLLTHAALRSAEVPVLRSLGCEVWTQKRFPEGMGYRSNSTDLSWDAGL